MTRIVNRTKGTVLATEARVARSFCQRTVGLMGRGRLDDGEGLVVDGTQGVHTHLMRFAIDVVFYDRERVVLAVAHGLKPWRFSKYVWRAGGLVELPAGTATATQTAAGDQLSFED